MNPGAFCEEKLFDFRRCYSLSVIAHAHLKPRSCRADHEAKPPGSRRGMEPVLDRVLYQRLEGEKVALKPSTNANRSSAPPSIGHQIAATRCLNKHALLPTLPRAVLRLAPVGQALRRRNWRSRAVARGTSRGATVANAANTFRALNKK